MPGILGDALLTGAMAGKGVLGPTLSAYSPTWRERAAQWLLGDRYGAAKQNFVSGLMGTTGLGQSGMGLADLTPAGVPMAVQEAYRSGDPQAMAMALMPAYHGTTKAGAKAIRSAGFSKPAGREPAVFLSDSPSDAYEFARMRAYGNQRDAKVVRSQVDDTGFYQADAGGEIYTPELMERILTEARDSGAPGATIKGIQNFEWSTPTTTYAVFDPSRVVIDILRKYGLAGLLPAGTAAGATIGSQQSDGL